MTDTNLRPVDCDVGCEPGVLEAEDRPTGSGSPSICSATGKLLGAGKPEDAAEVHGSRRGLLVRNAFRLLEIVETGGHVVMEVETTLDGVRSTGRQCVATPARGPRRHLTRPGGPADLMPGSADAAFAAGGDTRIWIQTSVDQRQPARRNRGGLWAEGRGLRRARRAPRAGHVKVVVASKDVPSRLLSRRPVTERRHDGFR
jgi:hypothetical protein